MTAMRSRITGNPEDFRERILSAEEVVKHGPGISKFEVGRRRLTEARSSVDDRRWRGNVIRGRQHFVVQLPLFSCTGRMQVSAVANWPARQSRAVDRAWRSVR